MTKKLLIFVMLFLVATSMSSCKIKKALCKHSYEEVVHAPTCREEGYTEHTCTKCGKSYNDTTTEKIAHTYTPVINPPTCTTEGFTEHICSACGDKYTSDIVALTAHRFNGGACTYCSLEEIKDNITADTEWFDETALTFTITTKEQLAGLASLVNSGMISADTIFYLEADIDLAYYEWIPVGTEEHPFAASFKGEGHTISSLKINAGQDYVGLFGKVTGTISDFNLVNATIYVKDAHNYIGTVCGYSQNSLSGISASGFVDAEKSANVGGVAGAIANIAEDIQSSVAVRGADCVGGIAGMATPQSAVFSKLTNTGTVEGATSVGGILGYLDASGTIQTDYISNTGDISGKAQVGGVVGHANAKVGSAVYNASVCANITGDYYVGGVIGRTESISVKECTNDGSTVTAISYFTNETSFYAWLGGYVGSGYEVTDCINNATIVYNSRGSYVGGVAGYLSYGISNCENTVSISAHNNVGGVVGYLNASGNANINKLKNSGAVIGNECVGGIIGGCSSTTDFTLSALENTGSVTATGFKVGGIVGNLNCGSKAVTAADLINTGNVLAEKYEVGGIFGYANASQANSIIKHCTSTASITGAETVGGLIGRTNIAIKDCSNEGSTVTATNWHTDGGTDYVWLGGYVGDGYKVTGCTNNSDITYAGTGIYVGGIIGYATGEIQDCSNSGNISSNTSHIGGVAGCVQSSVALTFKNLKNTGDISGKQRVGGIIGHLIQETGAQGAWILDAIKGRDCCTYYYHMYKTETKIDNVTNLGNVSASDEWGYAGGIIGLVQTSSSYYTGKLCHCGYYRCYYIGCFTISASNLTNMGMVSAKANVGELIGQHYSDGERGVASSVTTYTVTGSVTLNGEVVEGSYDVGSNTNLSLSNREIYVPEVEAPEETPEGTTEGTTEGE